MDSEFTYWLPTIITGIIGLLTTIAGSWSAWYFARQKYDVQVESGQLENTEKNLEIYQRMLDDLDKRRMTREAELEKKISDLQSEVIRLSREVEECRKRH